MTDDQSTTLGDALGPGVTKDDLADTERVLKRFEAVAMDEFDGEEEWIQTAHRAVTRALEHYDSELGEQPDERPAGLNADVGVLDGLLETPPKTSGDVHTSGAWALRRTFGGDVIVYRAVERNPTQTDE